MLLNSFEIIAPALVIGIFVAIVHAPLGIEVLRRGIIFIDLAIAQIAGLGFVAAEVLIEHPPVWLAAALALSFALLAGVGFYWVQKNAPEHQEAIIGSSFVAAASLTVLLLADMPSGGETIRHLLSGQIVFVTWPQIFLVSPIYAVILLVWLLRPSFRSGLAFYFLFAVAITTSVVLVGIYVVFASLILPALAASGAGEPYQTAWLSGILSVLLGVVVATWLDLPAGPTLVIAYCVIAISIVRVNRWIKIH